MVMAITRMLRRIYGPSRMYMGIWIGSSTLGDNLELGGGFSGRPLKVAAITANAVPARFST